MSSERALMLPPSLEINRRPKPPLCRIELHVHLSGAGRYSTLYELLKEKALPLPGNGGFGDFVRACQVQQPKDLNHFLQTFAHFSPAYKSDPVAWKRIALEFCEDQSNNGVIYFEARLSPHHLVDQNKHPDVTPEAMVQATVDGFKEGEARFGIKARIILCCIRKRGKEAVDTVRICKLFREKGVVGIDIAGDEGNCVDANGRGLELDPLEIWAFEEAYKAGIHRTVHAGEAGPAEAVRQAIEVMHAERIGHGYRVLQNEQIYQMCRDKNIHFETCPSSSLLTAGVKLGSLLDHPILQFAEDNASFSLNTDDPTVTGTLLNFEYDMVRSWGLTEAHLVRSNFHALEASFLPKEEKDELRQKMLEVYGIN